MPQRLVRLEALLQHFVDLIHMLHGHIIVLFQSLHILHQLAASSLVLCRRLLRRLRANARPNLGGCCSLWFVVVVVVVVVIG